MKKQNKNRVDHYLSLIHNDSKCNIERLALAIMTERGEYGNDGARKCWTEAVITELVNLGLLK